MQQTLAPQTLGSRYPTGSSRPLAWYCSLTAGWLNLLNINRSQLNIILTAARENLVNAFSKDDRLQNVPQADGTNTASTSKIHKKRKKQTGVLKGENLGSSFRTPINVEMQAELRFEPELMAVCAALKDAALLGLWIGIKEQQKLFVQEPEHTPEKAAFAWSHISTFRAPGASSNATVVLGRPALMSHRQASRDSAKIRKGIVYRRSARLAMTRAWQSCTILPWKQSHWPLLEFPVPSATTR